MYLKLALKNMKQSTKDYLIYMITLVLSVAMFYGFFSIVSPYYSNMLPISIHMEILNKEDCCSGGRNIDTFFSFLCKPLYAKAKTKRVCTSDNYWYGTKNSSMDFLFGEPNDWSTRSYTRNFIRYLYYLN